MSGLKIWTLRRAICARRSRRMSSSLFPLNMLPVITSIHPAFGRCWVISTSELTNAGLLTERRLAEPDHARDRYSPVSVLIRTLSPVLTNGGAVHMRPVLTRAGVLLYVC